MIDKYRDIDKRIKSISIRILRRDIFQDTEKGIPHHKNLNDISGLFTYTHLQFTEVNRDGFLSLTLANASCFPKLVETFKKSKPSFNFFESFVNIE